ncbi:MAG: hypothetical protein J5885_04060 [Clostridia bacterium]|nr:hypothetical protein [Clostridia bacterium]
MKNVKIGFLPLYVKLYDDGSPGVRPRINAFADRIAGLFSAKPGVELIRGDICRLHGEFAAAMAQFEREGADCVVTLHLAYSPSLESEKVLKNTKLPIIILDTTPTYDFTDNEEPSIMYNHGIHGVQDMCNLLVRNRKQFFLEAGHFEKSDVLDRVVARARGVRAATELSRSKVGRIGGEFAGMGDFCLKKEEYDRLGIQTTEMTPEEAKTFFADVTDEEIDAQIADDEKRYEIDADIDPVLRRESVRGDLAVRAWIEERGLTAFTANFLGIKRAFGIGGMPFAEAERAMERGVGYAGEGDLLTTALVGALMGVCPETTFAEMFCPDWKNNLIFISHMGEMNTALAAEKPRYMAKPMAYSDIDTAWLCGTYRAGTATLMDLAPLGDGKFRVITSRVEMKVPDCEKYRKDTICGWFAPAGDVGDFLRDYSLLGGTHHLALMYGDQRSLAETFAAVRGFEYFEIPSEKGGSNRD